VLLPSAVENNQLQELLLSLKPIQSVTKDLQNLSLTLYEVRGLLDAVLELPIAEFIEPGI